MRIRMGDIGGVTSGLMSAAHIDEHDARKQDAYQRAKPEFTQSPEIHRPAMVRLVIAMRHSCHNSLKALTYFPAPRRLAVSARYARLAVPPGRAPTAHCAASHRSR